MSFHQHEGNITSVPRSANISFVPPLPSKFTTIELLQVNVCATAEEAVRNSDVVFTQTPGAKTVLELDWLRPHATIIASGSDQPTKNEIPADVQKASKMVCDLVRQCKQVGELRSAIKAGLMTEEDVYAEIGDVVNGTKPGRVGDELILVDLTGTGAQDAAIGQVAWDILSKK